MEPTHVDRLVTRAVTGPGGRILELGVNWVAFIAGAVRRRIG